jgi:hypothetical protein
MRPFVTVHSCNTAPKQESAFASCYTKEMITHMYYRFLTLYCYACDWIGSRLGQCGMMGAQASILRSEGAIQQMRQPDFALLPSPPHSMTCTCFPLYESNSCESHRHKQNQSFKRIHDRHGHGCSGPGSNEAGSIRWVP